MLSTRSIADRGGLRKRLVVAIAGTSLLLAGAGSVGLSALADPVDSNIASSCSLGGSQVAVTVPLTVDDKVDPIAAGGQEALETKTGFPALPVEVTIDKMVVTEPIPDQIASTDSVTFSGGNMTATYEVSGQSLVLTFTGPVSSKDMQVPVVTANQTVKDAIAPTTIEWKPFSQIVADTNYGQATCVPDDPNQNVNTTSVVDGGSTPTTPPTTTPGTTTPPSTTPTTPGTPPTKTPGGVPGLPAVPGVPTPGLPSVPAPPTGLPTLPAPPSLPAPPAIPGVPTGPCPSLPLPLPVPLPPVPVGCPTIPPLPAAPALPALPVPPTPPLPGISLEVGVTAHVR